MGCFSSRSSDQAVVKAQVEFKEQQKLPAGRVQVEPVKIGKNNEKHTESSRIESQDKPVVVEKPLISEKPEAKTESTKREDKTRQNSNPLPQASGPKTDDETVSGWLQDIYKSTLITITAKV